MRQASWSRAVRNKTVSLNSLKSDSQSGPTWPQSKQKVCKAFKRKSPEVLKGQDEWSILGLESEWVGIGHGAMMDVVSMGVKQAGSEARCPGFNPSMGVKQAGSEARCPGFSPSSVPFMWPWQFPFTLCASYE